MLLSSKQKSNISKAKVELVNQIIHLSFTNGQQIFTSQISFKNIFQLQIIFPFTIRQLYSYLQSKCPNLLQNIALFIDPNIIQITVAQLTKSKRSITFNAQLNVQAGSKKNTPPQEHQLIKLERCLKKMQIQQQEQKLNQDKIQSIEQTLSSMRDQQQKIKIQIISKTQNLQMLIRDIKLTSLNYLKAENYQVPKAVDQSLQIVKKDYHSDNSSVNQSISDQSVIQFQGNIDIYK